MTVSGPFFIGEMLPEFNDKVSAFASTNKLFHSEGKILLAVSGGPDSIALLHVMTSLQARGIFENELLCAHFNHRLRGAESDGDEKFVLEAAKRLGLVVKTKRLDVRGFARENKLSIETAARKLRLRNLMDIAGDYGCSRIATGHHMDDNAETVIQRLARGAAFRGLGGIWPLRTFAGGIDFIRPLLCVRRAEIIEYLKTQNLPWRRDRTNADCRFRRNFIRHRLLPMLESQSSGSLTEQLSDLSDSTRRFYKLICDCADAAWPQLAELAADKVVMDLTRFSEHVQPVKVELVRRSLAYLGCGERNLTHEHFERVLELAKHNISGRRIELPGGFRAWREYGRLHFSPERPDAARTEQLTKGITVNAPGQTRFGRYLIEAAIIETKAERAGGFETPKTNLVESFDLNKLVLPIDVHLRRVGERFVPLGQTRAKKVGKFLTAQRASQRIREKVLIVADREKIIWVWPIRMSEQAKVTEQTRSILRMKITDSPRESRIITVAACPKR